MTKGSITLMLLLFSVALYAQKDYNAKLTYKVGLKLHNENTSLTKGQKEYNAFFKNVPKQTYYLDINKQESIFYRDKKMNVDASKTNDLVSAAVGSGSYYHNSKTNLTLNDKNILGEDFLIQTKKKYKWELSSEKKMIRGYLCFKATTKEVYYNRIGEKKTKTITAWYYPKTPINIGVKDYHGLPGVILLLNAGDVYFECVKIALTLNESLKVNKPKKGKLITEKEYNQILKTNFTKKFGIK